MIIDFLIFVVGIGFGWLAMKALYGLELEKSAKRKLHEEGKTDYYGNKIEDE